MKKERIVVVCPGRGSYGSDELTYLNTFHNDKSEFIEFIDSERQKLSQKTLTELDQAPKFKPSIHTKGENASILIYACAYLDFLSINQDKYEIVAITGNSMGWYIALACANAVDEKAAFTLINSMGSMMVNGNIGGQVLYPTMNDQWQFDSMKSLELDRLIESYNSIDGVEIFDSIYLGGNRVLGANEKGVKFLLNELPKVKMGNIEYPFQLINHAAFHTPLLEDTSKQAFDQLPQSLFQKFNYPLIDGRGKIWMPYSSDIDALRNYTLGHQVTEPYYFDKAVDVSIKEFAPDKIVLLGPGGSLGSSIAQIGINSGWKQIETKEQFITQQKENPLLISMGRKDQRNSLLFN